MKTPTWKSEKVTSTKESVAFLERQLIAIEFKNIGKITNINTTALNQENGLTGPIYGKFNGSEHYLMNIQLEVHDDHILFKRLGIQPNLKRHALGTINTKCAIAIAHKHKKEKIKIENVINEGGTFWPYIGATTAQDKTFSNLLYCYQQGYSPHFTKKEHRQIKKIIRTEQKGERKKAWHMLAQSKINCPDGLHLGAYIFPEICQNQDLILEPAHPETAKVLKKRIGTSPSFCAEASL